MIHECLDVVVLVLDIPRYELFEYVGGSDAEVLFVSVGDASAVVRGTVEALADKAKVGAVIVHLLRPWDSQRFVASVPTSGSIR